MRRFPMKFTYFCYDWERNRLTMLGLILAISIINLVATAGFIGIWVYDHFKYNTIIVDENNNEIDNKFVKMLGKIM